MSQLLTALPKHSPRLFWEPPLLPLSPTASTGHVTYPGMVHNRLFLKCMHNKFTLGSYLSLVKISFLQKTTNTLLEVPLNAVYQKWPHIMWHNDQILFLRSSYHKNIHTHVWLFLLFSRIKCKYKRQKKPSPYMTASWLRPTENYYYNVKRMEGRKNWTTLPAKFWQQVSGRVYWRWTMSANGVWKELLNLGATKPAVSWNCWNQLSIILGTFSALGILGWHQCLFPIPRSSCGLAAGSGLLSFSVSPPTPPHFH